MDFIDEDVKLAVKKGAVWLDENYPDWVGSISLYDLDMAECSDCIIGQVIGDYNDLIGPKQTFAWAVEHGFEARADYVRDIMDEYRNLETVWTAEVEKRLG